MREFYPGRRTFNLLEEHDVDPVNQSMIRAYGNCVRVFRYGGTRNQSEMEVTLGR